MGAGAGGDPSRQDPLPGVDELRPYRPLVHGIRWGAVALGVVTAVLRGDLGWPVLIGTIVLLAHAIWRSFRPLLYVRRRLAIVVSTLAELGVVLATVAGTGYWRSPFVFSLLTPVVASGFAVGLPLAIRTAVATSVAITVPLLVNDGWRLADAQISAQWTAELLLAGAAAGYARGLFGAVELQHSRTLDRVTRLSEANSLLTSLHRVAQTLPASLDMNEVLESTVQRLRELVTFDVVALLLWDAATSTWSLGVGEGVRISGSLQDEELPPSARAATTGTAVRLEPRLTRETGPGLSAFSRSGLYAPLRARGTLLGLLVVEHREPDHFGDNDIQLLQGLVEPVALAIDNARWFSRLRTVGAHEERSRIARDLHDRVGQSLAYLGFQLDRLVKLAEQDAVREELEQLRKDVREVVGEVRETLYDLRTDVSEERGLGETLAEFLERVSERSEIDIDFEAPSDVRLALPREREVWRIAQEAIANAERHSGAEHLTVRWECDADACLLLVSDDGRGFPSGHGGRSDSYGLVGMRERADAVGARLEVESAPGRGTTVRCRLDVR